MSMYASSRLALSYSGSSSAMILRTPSAALVYLAKLGLQKTSSGHSCAALQVSACLTSSSKATGHYAPSFR